MKEELRQTAQANIKKMHATHYFSPSAPKPVCPPLPNAELVNPWLAAPRPRLTRPPLSRLLRTSHILAHAMLRSSLAPSHLSSPS